jgi:pimeloyl-ACP methyl ester carboxylesterase
MTIPPTPGASSAATSSAAGSQAPPGRGWLALLLGTLLLAAAAVLFAAMPAVLFAATPEAPRYGAELEGFDYPQPVQRFRFESQQKALHMAYLDLAPSGTPNGRSVVLLHGKNFCAASWVATLEVLRGAGYRVIAPDQVGFCKSSKPRSYQYSLQQLADNTERLLASLKLSKVTLLGHSMGGMLATRYALTYPDRIEQLVLVNPIGLEDWKAQGVPYQSIDSWYKAELETTAERIRSYQTATYYAGSWKPEYDVWVQMLAGMYSGPGKELVAWSSALTYDMIYTQPVFYEFERLRMPVLLLIGNKDNTAIGKNLAPEAVRKTLGNYAQLGPAVARRIPHARLVSFDELGHAPQLQDPARFHEALLKGLAR